MVKAILIDFGGVVAEEGFREGLYEIARKNKLDPDAFYAAADAVIYESGYLTGKAGESDYWNELRKKTGIRGTDESHRGEILKRFVLRPRVIRCVDLLRSGGFMVVMLSDQTNWLDEINAKEQLFRHFDRVFNSFQIKMSKREASTFRSVCGMLGVNPGETVFIDDNKNHIARAAQTGLNTILFTAFDDFNEQIRLLTGTSCSDLIP